MTRRPGASRGHSAYPQIRFVSLVENGTHVLFGSRMAGYATGEHRDVEAQVRRHAVDALFLGRQQVDLVMDFLENRDTALFVNVSLLRRQNRTGAQLLKHIVHIGHS